MPAVLQHWRKLGRFRRDHPAVGAGIHRTLQAKPFIFSRTLETGGKLDRVLVAMDQEKAPRRYLSSVYSRDGTRLVDAYSGVGSTVKEGKVSLTTRSGLVLLAERR